MSADLAALRLAFQRTFGHDPVLVSEAPGRVNLIGEHTDYNLGYVLPVAIDRTVAAASAPGDDGRVRVYSADFGECDEFSLARIERTQGASWRNYVRGVAWALARAGHSARGVELAIAGDVPRGAGLSSSAALEVAVAGALAAVSELVIRPRDLALIAREAENGFVGVQSGIMDQFASALGLAGHALLIDCRSLDVDAVPLEEAGGVAIVVVDSKAPRRLEETAYNQRREECKGAARLLGVTSLREADDRLLEASAAKMPAHLYQRARHVVAENGRVLAAVQALRAGELETLGRLMDESHASLRDDFEVSTPELDLLAELARNVHGTLGARLTGAGFGGSIVSLVRRGAAEDFRSQVLGGYRRETGLVAEMYICRAAGGMKVTHV